MKTLKETIEVIKDEARRSWPGAGGEKRAEAVEAFIRGFLPEYSIALNLSPDELLEAIETKRRYSATNFYQTHNFPPLKDVTIYATEDEAREDIGRRFRCPHCGGISTSPYECNSGVEIVRVFGKKPCDWKSYGLFGCLGKGFQFTVRTWFPEFPKIERIFMPLNKEKSVTD